MSIQIIHLYRFREAKQLVREYVRTAADHQLVRLLDNARAGTVVYTDCQMCLVGHISGEHAFDVPTKEFFAQTGRFDKAYFELGFVNETSPLGFLPEEDALRCRRLVPIVRVAIQERANLLLQELDEAQALTFAG